MLSKNLLSEIKKKSDLLSSLKPLSDENQAKLDKKIRLEFNFNSNHLEGNTLTYGETELLLIFDQTEGSHDYREYQEMQAHDVALKMIQEEADEKQRPLTENFIRSLNDHILVRPFWKDAITQDGQSTRKKIIPGEYKTSPNSVRLSNNEIFNYTSPLDVQQEMRELVQWYNENSKVENPVVLAALLHYRFVRIHPFDDGNGRTARLLMNYVLLSNDLPLIIIKSDEKKAYLAALNRADTGDVDSFTEYIAEQLLWSLDLCVRAAKGENIDDDDDLDKELELLNRELTEVPDEYDKVKSYEEIVNLFDNSLVPLHNELENKIAKISDLFVTTTNAIHYQIIESGSWTKRVLTHENLVKVYSDVKGSPFKGKVLASISIEVELIALKKVTEKIDISYGLDIWLEDYHYSVFDRNTSKVLLKLPYGRLFTQAQIAIIVRTIINYIIAEIKAATNLDNY